jgi:hypothetical protein
MNTKRIRMNTKRIRAEECHKCVSSKGESDDAPAPEKSKPKASSASLAPVELAPNPLGGRSAVQRGERKGDDAKGRGGEGERGRGREREREGVFVPLSLWSFSVVRACGSRPLIS